jgi:hypothetical protein
MMRRIWAAVLAVWATLAIIAALAWSHPTTAQGPQATPVTIFVPGKHGRPHAVRVLVSAPGTATHASTHTSPVVR